jgi:hypothetical protein
MIRSSGTSKPKKVFHPFRIADLFASLSTFLTYAGQRSHRYPQNDTMCLFIVPPVQVLLLSQPICVALKTKTVMTTNHTSAGGTAPFLLFILEELFHPVLFDRGEIFKKAHMKKRRISRIKLRELLTGKICTFITKLYGVIEEIRTSFFQKRTFLIPGTTAFTARHPDTFPFQVMLHRKVSTADVTVHPARRDKLLRKVFPHRSHHELCNKLK